MLDPSVIHQAPQRLIAVAHCPVKVILFGSYARGDAGEDSDLDLLVVEKEIPDPTGEYVRLREAIGAVGVGVDLLVFSEAEYERRRDWCSTPVYWTIREGRVLHECPA